PDLHLREQGLPAAQAPRRGGCPAAPGEDRGQAEEADAGAGRLHRRIGRRAVQAGPLPLLIAVSGAVLDGTGASAPVLFSRLSAWRRSVPGCPLAAAGLSGCDGTPVGIGLPELHRPAVGRTVQRYA